MSNVNNKEYWNFRFSTGDWGKSGSIQTEEYANANVNAIGLGIDFQGSILDFGCALGDAIPIYAAAFPKANLRGIDISQVAIDECKKKYGGIADFSCGDYEGVEFSDVIIASHIMEHLSDDKNIVNSLLGKCKDMFVIVPYMESPLYFEHVNYYESSYYSEFEPIRTKIFDVTYKPKFWLKKFVIDILKLRYRLNRDFSKKMILFHLKGTCLKR